MPRGHPDTDEPRRVRGWIPFREGTLHDPLVRFVRGLAHGRDTDPPAASSRQARGRRPRKSDTGAGPSHAPAGSIRSCSSPPAGRRFVSGTRGWQRYPRYGRTPPCRGAVSARPTPGELSAVDVTVLRDTGLVHSGGASRCRPDRTAVIEHLPGECRTAHYTGPRSAVRSRYRTREFRHGHATPRRGPDYGWRIRLVAFSAPIASGKTTASMAS